MLMASRVNKNTLRMQCAQYMRQYLMQKTWYRDPAIKLAMADGTLRAF